jgi:hypothetical protein
MAKAKGSRAVAVQGRSWLEPLGSGENWESEVSERAKKAAATATGGIGWSFVSTKGGRLSYNGADLGTECDFVILGAILENQYFKKKYDPTNVVPPDCFAVAYSEKEMAPPADHKGRESATCATCWADAFGSGDGRGKACRNYVRLAVLPADQATLRSPETIAKAEGAMLRIPPTSKKEWTKFVNAIVKGLGANLHEFATRVSVVGDDETQFKVMLEPIGRLPRRLSDAIVAKAAEADAYLERTPDVSEKAPKRGGAAPVEGRRKVTRRKAR